MCHVNAFGSFFVFARSVDATFATMFPAVCTEVGLNDEHAVDRRPPAGASWATKFGELVESFLNDPVLGPHLRSEVRRLSHLI